MKRRGHSHTKKPLRQVEELDSKQPAANNKNQVDSKRRVDGFQLSLGNKWVVRLITASGWIAAGLMGFLNLPAAINSFNKELPSAAESTGVWKPIDSRFSGAWTKAENCNIDFFEVGNLSEESDTKHSLDMMLKLDGNSASGQIISNGLRENHFYPEVEMVGEVQGSNVRMRVVDWIDGKPQTLAIISISRVNMNCLEFKTLSQASDFFPKAAWMSRETTSEFQGISRGGGRGEKLIEQAVKRANQSMGHGETK